MRIAVIEGSFSALDKPIIDWIGKVRRNYGRVHVALWPNDSNLISEQIIALNRLPAVWEVHLGRAKDVAPWLEQSHPEAEITVVAMPSEIFEPD